MNTVNLFPAAVDAASRTTKITQARGASTKYGKQATAGKLCFLLPDPGMKRGNVKLTLRLGTNQGGYT
mgnify:CR=1 FL=1